LGIRLRSLFRSRSGVGPCRRLNRGRVTRVWCGLTRQPVDVFAGSDRQSDARTFDVHGFSFLARCP
jgi:hypothetical protein